MAIVPATNSYTKPQVAIVKQQKSRRYSILKFLPMYCGTNNH
jgi:hypothetical protein